MDTLYVIKRNGKTQIYNETKIALALQKAFNSMPYAIENKNCIIQEIISELKIKNMISIEDIQNQLEEILMKKAPKVAKKFIIYREEHSKDRDIFAQKEFIYNYIRSINAATGSRYDANSNVTEKNITTLTGELPKGRMIQLNRAIIVEYLNTRYGTEVQNWKFGKPTSYADEYINLLSNHFIYKHDETSIYPYCVAVTMYPLLAEGLQKLGGISNPPKHLRSFCGIFVNFAFTIAAQFAGAVATPEFLMYFDYFCRKEWGKDYYKHLDDICELNEEGVKEYNEIISSYKEIMSIILDENISDLEVRNQIKEIIQKTSFNFDDLSGNTIGYIIKQYLQNVVYYLNQPAAARNFQSIFWNIGYFDKFYFEGIFSDFCFPDGTKPQWESLNWLQKYFMNWFNEERKVKLLTFPVETMACLTDGKENFQDEEYFDHTAEMYSKGHSFFTYLSDSPDSLSSCCRLRNEVQENTFSYTLGAGGVATGSKSVMTININRVVQFAIKNGWNILDYIRELVQKVQCFQLAYNDYLNEMYEHNMLTVYNAGFISLKQQYLTLGVNGVVESAEFLGFTISPNEDYKNYMESILKIFYEENKKQRTKEIMFNTEFIPGENLGVKFATWDRKDGYVVPRDCYNSYFYIVEDESISILDKFKMHGKDFVKYLDGGSALHCNLDAHLSKEQYKQLLKFAVKEGTNYFTFNIPNTICNDCNHIDKRYLKECPICGSKNIDYATRVIGYLKRVSNFAQPRQEESSRRYYSDIKNNNNEKDINSI